MVRIFPGPTWRGGRIKVCIYYTLQHAESLGHPLFAEHFISATRSTATTVAQPFDQHYIITPFWLLLILLPRHESCPYLPPHTHTSKYNYSNTQEVEF
jgi:hypothetical protein